MPASIPCVLAEFYADEGSLLDAPWKASNPRRKCVVNLIGGPQMQKPTRDLGDLSFTNEELRELQKAERKEAAGKSAPPRVSESEKKQKRQYVLWDILHKITAQ